MWRKNCSTFVSLKKRTTFLIPNMSLSFNSITLKQCELVTGKVLTTQLIVIPVSSQDPGGANDC